MDPYDPAQAFIAGQLMSAAVSLAGMMAAFNWATFLERGDVHGVRSYRRNTMVVVVFLLAFPVVQMFI